MESLQQKNNIDNDLSDYEEKIQKLQADNKRLQEEFNNQRAKLRELFLQKENELKQKVKENAELQERLTKLQGELDDAKSQLVVTGMTLESSLEAEKRKAEDEIASLQRLIHETVEESSSSKTVYDSEIRKLQNTIQELEHEIGALKSERRSVQEHTTGLVPSVMLSAVTKTLARKLGAADVFSSPDADGYQRIDNNDDHTKEDAEVLRSLVIPLEEEIKALKDKLRAADEQLQKCQQCRHIPDYEASNNSQRGLLNSSFELVDEQTPLIAINDCKKSMSEPSQISANCDMCRNYEAQLVREQRKVSELESKVSAAEKAAEKHREELLKEIGFRKEMEEKWNEKKEEHKQQVAELTRRTECAEQDLKEAQQFFKQTCIEVDQRLKDLSREREKVDKELNRLQRENENLVGKYSIHAEKLQSEMINLPNTVDELQEVLLKNIDDLIVAKIAKEAAEQKVNILHSDIMLLKDQITIEQQEKESIENSLDAEINRLRNELRKYEVERKQFVTMEEKIAGMQQAHQNFLRQLEEANRGKKQLEEQNNELKSRISSLQQELDNSEAVQKDFVRLSQDLQVQLEKIRDSDNQVRWQFEEDVEECPGCRTSFAISKRRKQNCRHCGQIYCTNCLTHTVLSGPNQRPSQVCDVCHTLLDKSSAPYFSTEVPHSPG